MKVAINGAGIAGPTAAYWLLEAGYEVLLVEAAPELRRGGYVVDFWGSGYDVAERMGLLPRILADGYQVQEVRFVDATGRKRGSFPVSTLAGLTHDRFTSIRRSDLSAAIFAAIESRVETLFDDGIVAIEDERDGVRVHFMQHRARDVDLVIGADGLHSRVRELVFGPQHEVALGYHVAAFEVTGYRPCDELVYVSHALAGRQLSRFAMRDDRTLFLFVFVDEFLDREPKDDAEKKHVLWRVFEDTGWEASRILDAMQDADEIYFDRVSQIRLSHWSQGRVALVGDAAACVSLLAGEGAGLGMLEAYVLAGELRSSNGDHAVAFDRYEKRLAPFLATKQKAAARFASSFAPRTELGVRIRNAATHLMRIPYVAKLLLGRTVRDEITLPTYGP